MSRGKMESSLALGIIKFTKPAGTFADDYRVRIGIRKHSYLNHCNNAVAVSDVAQGAMIIIFESVAAPLRRAMRAVTDVAA
jgi:hypothetical protein